MSNLANIHYPNVVNAFFDTKWAITPEAMQRIVPVVQRWAFDIKTSRQDVEAIVEARQKPLRKVDGKVAIIPVMGVLTQRAGLFEELSGATSTEKIGKEFDMAMDNKEIAAIVLNIDSPGGSVFGIQELGDKIASAKGKKPVYALANSQAASAAYWLGSQAEQFYGTPGGEVGSIGVLALHWNVSEQNKMMGMEPTFIHAGKYKVEGNPFEALGDEALEKIQADVNSYYDDFIGAVAKGRGVTPAAVRGGFGQGRMYRTTRAVGENMIDRVMTLEQLLERLGDTNPTRPGSRRAEDDQPEINLEDQQPAYTADQLALERKRKRRQPVS